MVRHRPPRQVSQLGLTFCLSHKHEDTGILLNVLPQNSASKFFGSFSKQFLCGSISTHCQTPSSGAVNIFFASLLIRLHKGTESLTSSCNVNALYTRTPRPYTLFVLYYIKYYNKFTDKIEQKKLYTKDLAGF